MVGLQGKTLFSQCLSFRLLEENDRESLFALLQDPSVTRPAGFLPPISDEEKAEFWQGLTGYKTGVAILLGETCIGYYHINPYRTDDPEYSGKKNVSIGIVIGGAYQGKGFGKETVLTMNDFLLQQFDHVWGESFEDNTASQKLFLSCGFREVNAYDMVFESLNNEKKHIISFVY